MENSLDSLCRLCCLQLSDESSLDLFERKNGHVVADLVTVICPIVIERNERNLPDRICCDCFDRIIDAINLRDVSLINDKELRKKSEENREKFELIIEEEDEEVYVEALDEVLDHEMIKSMLPMQESLSKVDTKPKKPPTMTDYCELCGNFFCNPSSFKRHQLRKHQKVCYTCDLCNANFKTKRDIEQHLKKRHAYKQQPAIRFLFAEKLSLQLSELYEKLDEPEPMVCTYCSYTDNDEESLNCHLRLHQAVVDSGKMYCIHCPTAIETMEFMIEHTRSHNDPIKTHRCLICNKTFPFDENNLSIKQTTKSSSLLNHVNHHLKSQHLICFCPHCGRKFSKPRVLEDHIRFIHNQESNGISCPDCGKGFGSKSALNGHVKRHIEGNKYLCPFCPKSFSSHNLLISHKVVHSKDRPFACTLCEKTFKHQKVLNDHLKRHDVSRQQFPCPICSRLFMTSYSLTRHVKLHSGDKPFKCEFCSKAFAQKNDLNKHLRSHVGENTYFCDFPGCDLTFRIQAELKFHQGSHYVST